ncbi:amidohydrolase family protein [bacterium]|nr:amidohydrolase family protein [bacterium]
MSGFSQIPQLILTNGKFYTQDNTISAAEAIAIANGRIIGLGDSKTILKSAEHQTEIINLGGRRVLPGMIDSHFHYHEWAFMRRHLNLAKVSSFAECLTVLKNEANKKNPGEWIIGQGFNESDWPENKMPLRKDLDRITTAHPLIIWRCDLHLAVANSVALGIANIGPDTPNPPEGIIEKDGTSQPTGVLRELAINLVKKTILELMDKDIVNAMYEGIHTLNGLGLTGVHDIRLMGGLEGASALKAWESLEQSTTMNIRAWVALPGEYLDEAITLGLKSGFGNDKLRIGHVKFFADGGMGARTAYMIDPYLDADVGMPLTPMSELEFALKRADNSGLAVMIHAIGDRTNRELVDLLERVMCSSSQQQQKQTQPSMPHRIEHLQMIRTEDIQRLGAIKRVAGCVQPHNLVLDINMVEQSVGNKGRFAYCFRDMLDAGINVMFSSDTPVCDPSPLVGIHAAVTRQRADGTPKNGWYPDQKVTVEEAIYAYTMAPALASGAGHTLGSLSIGKFADMVVLDRDILSIDPADIINTSVELTLVDGQIAYRTANL